MSSCLCATSISDWEKSLKVIDSALSLVLCSNSTYQESNYGFSPLLDYLDADSFRDGGVLRCQRTWSLPVRVLVPLERLKQNHEVAGFTFGVIGAFYGLLLAFVIVAAWERFDRAEAEVQGESVALASLYQLSKGFAEPAATRLQMAVRAYTHKIIDEEWP